MTEQTQHPTNDFTLNIGDILTLTPTAIAHGGALVARHNGRVIFVRHGVIGETAQARITGKGPKGKFFFADTIAVENPAPERRQHPWELADPLNPRHTHPVGGMEFGHLTPATQRNYKQHIITEQLNRLGKIPATHPVLQQLTVEELPGGELGTRTRIHCEITPQGDIAMHPHQSNTLIPVQSLPLATAAINQLHLEQLKLRHISRIDVAESSTGEIALTFTVKAPHTPQEVSQEITEQCTRQWGELSHQNVSLIFTAERQSGRARGERPRDVVQGTEVLTEQVETSQGTFTFGVSPSGFWQNHQYAPQTLLENVREFAAIQPGEKVYDLYAGAGLFTALAAHEVGENGYVLSVEGATVTHRNARENFAAGGVSRTAQSERTVVKVVRGDVGRVLAKLGNNVPKPDVVILDPAREGAGRVVMEKLDELNPSRIVYVACDPAALGRDTGYLRELGWELDKVVGLDMYPNTHHVETIARFVRSS